MNTLGSQKQLRIEQFETVHCETNLNPLGVPESVKRAISDHIGSVGSYPSNYYDDLKASIAEYAGCNPAHIVMRSGSLDLLRLFIGIFHPKKVLLPTPCSPELEKALASMSSKTVFLPLKEEEDFRVNILELAEALTDDAIGAMVISNPINPSSQLISRDELTAILDLCKEKDVLLVVDEMYIEFADEYLETTAVPLVEEYDNLAVIRSISKFFSVPGLRMAYGIMSNEKHMKQITKTAANYGISSITAVAAREMFKDISYIERSRSQVHTERNLIYSAMAPCKELRLFKPYANFMLVKLLKEDLTAGDVCEALRTKGLIIRNCSDFRGLDHTYIRFSFMNPRQNDLLVNSILELM